MTTDSTPPLAERLALRGFGLPRGLLGRLGGRLMARGNAATEQHLVDLADPGAEQVVLVLGPGPGVGLAAAARRSAHVVGVDPSEVMLAACRRRCAAEVAAGRVRLQHGTAERTGRPDASVDVVLTVNNVQIWPDSAAGYAELFRVLRPGGGVWLSAHAKWLPGGCDAVAAGLGAAGFRDVRTWTWEPPGRGAATAVQAHALR